MEKRPPVVAILGHVDHGKCVHPKTRITLADGSIMLAEEIWKKFSSSGDKKDTGNPYENVVEIKNGPSVFSWDGEKMRNSSITHLWKIKNNSKLLNFSLNSGNSIAVTPEHPFLVLDKKGKFKFLRADKISEGDFVAVPQTLNFKSNSLGWLKEQILNALAEAGNFTVFLDKNKSEKFKQELKKLNKQELYRKGFFSTAPGPGIQKMRFRIRDLIKLAEFLNLDIEETYNSIDKIKNSTEKWRAGHTSNSIKLPKSANDFKKLGYLTGLILGDGHLDSVNVSLYNNDLEIRKRYMGTLKAVFGLSPTKVKGHTADMMRSNGGKTLMRFLHCIFEIPIGKKSHKIRIPDIVKKSELMRKGIVEGLMDTDGYVSEINYSLELTSKSKELVYDIKTLLLENRIHGKVFTKNKFWYLKIANNPYLERFYKNYRLRVNRKRKRMEEAIQHSGTSRVFDITPISGKTLSNLSFSPKEFSYFEQYRKYNNLSRRFFKKLFSNHRESFDAVFGKSDLKQLINPSELSLVKVNKISPQKSEYVYDFSVPEFKNFVAEDTIVHNTTLLDYIRRDNVVKTEAGGITQAIGAYEIEHKGNKITFIDTPGHEAFSEMRARGAKVADLAVLVVAADDGVMPQTKDAIAYIKEAGISFIVAINKVDAEGANVEKVKNDLIKSEVYLEGMGGDISCQPISALKGEGVDELLDLVNLAAEVEGLEYDPEAPGEGVVITSNRSPKRGIIVGAIVKNGIVRKGDVIFSESTEGKIKILENFLGEQVSELKPSAPTLILGFGGLPEVGEKFRIGSKPKSVEKEAPKEIREVSEEEENGRIKIVIKADESGSLQALRGVVDRLSEEFPLVIIGEGVGDINESDIKDASNFNALILGFHTGIHKAAQNIAKTEKISILTSDIIYELEDMFKKYIEENVLKEERILEILAFFGKQEGNRQIVGGKVTKGYVENNESFEVFRDEKKIGEGRVINLQSRKEDIAKAEEEQEAGLLVEADIEIQKGYRLVFT